MRRIRLRTFMLLVVIAALSLALMAQRQQAARREAALQARLAEANAVVAERYQLGVLHIGGDERVIKKANERGGR
jgi:hypothetical protein